MMKYCIALGVAMVCTACAHTTEAEREAHEFMRVEYYETVYRPTSRACRRAGGFMILESPTHRRTSLSYAEMRMAVARGCGGI